METSAAEVLAEAGKNDLAKYKKGLFRDLFLFTSMSLVARCRYLNVVDYSQ